jgi:hypothetical protein
MICTKLYLGFCWEGLLEGASLVDSRKWTLVAASK